jgi:Uma2 family endonuclease
MVALRQPYPVHVSLTEFLDWDSGDRSGALWQLRDGRPEAMAPARQTHGAIQNEFGALLRNHLLDRNSACRVITNPGIVPRVRSEENVRIPDLAVACGPPGTARLLLDPVLVVEILSPSNADETWGNVWTYTTIPSVTEILVMSSVVVPAELLRRRPDGTRPEVAERLKPPATLELASVRFGVPLTALYRATAIDWLT